MMLLSLPLMYLRGATMSVPRRWVVIAAATLGLLVAFGLTTTISILIKPFEAEFGWSRSDISYAYTLLSAGAALGGLVVGWTFSTELIPGSSSCSASVVMAAGLLVLSFSSDLAAGSSRLSRDRRGGLRLLLHAADRHRGPLVRQGSGIGDGNRDGGRSNWAGRNTLAAPADDQRIRLAHDMRFACRRAPCSAYPDHAACHASRMSWPQRQWPREPRSLPCPPAVSIAWLSLAAVFCCASMAIPLVHLVPLLLDRGESIAVSGSLMFVAMLGSLRRADPDRNALRSHRRARRLRARRIASVDHRVLVRAAAVASRSLFARRGLWTWFWRSYDSTCAVRARRRCPRVWPGSAWRLWVCSPGPEWDLAAIRADTA